MLAAHPNHLVGPFEVDVQRLLDQHVLAGARRRHRHVPVFARRKKNVNNVDVLVVDQVMVVGVPALDAELLGERPDLVLVARADRNKSASGT